ncbi:CDP-glycerol:glycerophosphate glycerophosphotransferase [Methanobrevibacter sp.]|uniref:CDP-glycerol:glycerophosphate glycerophosphotransferase n=1 Tax=Methanobrevibacter sp. TaxID=66852 RepID=UPI00388CF21C
MEFSVIISANNLEKTENTINSLIKQSLDFNEFVDVIIINNSNNEDIKSIYEKYAAKYPQNFKYVENNERNLILSKNDALNNADGSYLLFLTSGDTLSKNTIKEVSEFFNKNNDLNVIGIPIHFIKDPKKNYWFYNRIKETQIIDLIESPDLNPLFGPAKFIRKTSIKDIAFEDVIVREDLLFVNELLIENPKIGFINSAKCETQLVLEKNRYLEDSQAGKEYYINSSESYFKILIDKSLEKYSEVPIFIQNSLADNIRIMLDAENTEEIFDDEEVNRFKSSMKDVLKYVDDEVILKNNSMTLYSIVHAFTLKYGEISDSLLSKINLNTVFIDTYNIVNNQLNVLANFPSIFDVNVDVFVNGEKIDKNVVRFPQRSGNYFNYTYLKDYSFEFSIPLSKKTKYELEFKLNGEALSIDFSRPCNFSKIVGYAKSKNYLSVLKDDKINIEHKTTLKWIKQEAKALVKMLKDKEPGFKVGIPFRLMYMVGYPFLRNKRIWFYMDYPNSADDNGMHMFKYSQDKDKDIKKYFVLAKDSKDYSKMQKIGKLLPYKSIKHRFLGLFVENIITSHPDNGIIYPFWGTYPHLAGLLKSNTIFLQHGIIKDDISPWLNKFSMDLSLLVTSSPQEYESIFENPYHYDENVVQVLGLPRFDNLKNEETKKQIFIMPSWRRPLTNKTKEFISKTEYFNRFNSLINNEKMIEFCKQHGYEIIFKPHPNVYQYIDLYDTNDYVKIDFDEIDYQTIFNNAALLITDYSSVAFDFSYLHKPILYYQYMDDYHFDVANGYFKYETMGFGEVCREENEIVDLICEYVANDCKIKDKYSKRVDDFFFYTDKNNCKRVYEAIKNINLKD